MSVETVNRVHRCTVALPRIYSGYPTWTPRHMVPLGLQQQPQLPALERDRGYVEETCVCVCVCVCVYVCVCVCLGLWSGVNVCGFGFVCVVLCVYFSSTSQVPSSLQAVMLY